MKDSKCSKCNPQPCQCHSCYPIAIGDCKDSVPVDLCQDNAYCEDGCEEECSAECVFINTTTLLEFYNSVNTYFDELNNTIINLQNQLLECCCEEETPTFIVDFTVNTTYNVSGTFDPAVNPVDIVFTVNGIVEELIIAGNTYSYVYPFTSTTEIQIEIPSVCGNLPFTNSFYRAP